MLEKGLTPSCGKILHDHGSVDVGNTGGDVCEDRRVTLDNPRRIITIIIPQ